MSEDILSGIVEDLLAHRPAGRPPLREATAAVITAIRDGRTIDDLDQALGAFDDLGATDLEARTLLAVASQGIRPSQLVLRRVAILNRRLAYFAEALERFLALKGFTADFESRDAAKRLAV